MTKKYKNNEDILTNEFVNSLKENIKKEEKPLPLIFDNIEKNTKCRKPNFNDNEKCKLITNEKILFFVIRCIIFKIFFEQKILINYEYYYYTK